MTPRVPQQTRPLIDSEPEPSERGWDEADTITTIPDETPRALPKVEARAPEKSGDKGDKNDKPALPRAEESGASGLADAAAAAATAAAGSSPSLQGQTRGAALSSATREEIWSIVRAAVEQAVAPVVAKQKDIEARIDRAERDTTKQPELGSRAPAPIPFSRAPEAEAPSRAAPTMRTQVIEVPATPVLPADAFPHDDPPVSRSKSPSVRPSFSATSYGLVMAHPPGPRPGIDLDMSNVGPIVDMPDFGRGRRVVGRLVIGLLLLGVAGAILATILSHA